jgi:hypothetical protein
MSGLIEVDVNRTPGKAPRIAKRLQNSPKTLFPSTPEKLQQRQEKAAEVRKVRFTVRELYSFLQSLFEERVAKAHAEVELAKKRSVNKPEPTLDECVEGQ